MAVGRKERRRKLNLMIFLMSVGNLILHLAVSENYELHRDAYLYLNYADHPAWGYISVPPFIMVLSVIATKVFGGSEFIVRLFPALAGAITVGMVGNLTKELGGKRWAVLMATLAFALSPAFLRTGSLYQPVSFNIMFWFMFFYLFIQMLRSKNLNYWYVIGLVVGLGMLNKYTMAIPLVFSITALLATGKFSMIFCRQFWIGMVGALIIILPNLLWQYNHNWPVFYHLNELDKTQFVNVRPVYFMNMQVLMNSHGLIIWLAGLVGLIAFKSLRNYLSVFIAFILMLLTLLLLGAKPYYMLGIYPVLFVFGAIYIERLTLKRDWILPIVTSFMAVIALLLLPLSLPILKFKAMSRYSSAFVSYGIVSPFTWEDGEVHAVPQDFADMIGWKNLTGLVNSAYYSLSEEEQQRTIIYGDNYGKVGAINYYNRKKDLPAGHSFNGSFLFWTPEELPENCILIFVNKDTAGVDSLFGEVVKFGELQVDGSRENGAPIFICKNPTPEFYEVYYRTRKELFKQFYRKQDEYQGEETH